MQRAGAGVLGEVSLLAAFLGSQISHALLPLMDWPVYVPDGHRLLHLRPDRVLLQRDEPAGGSFR